MAETSSPRRELTPAGSMPQKRPFEDEHAPPVSSPLYQELMHTVKTSPAVKDKDAMPRERREKKDTLKKREAKTGPAAAGSTRGTPDPSVKNGLKLPKSKDATPNMLAPLRYVLPPPLASDYEGSHPPFLTLHHNKPARDGSAKETQFYEVSETVTNRKGFRYSHCVADRSFPSSIYRPTETPPFHARISHEDCSSHILFTRDAKQITTQKGFRLARANVGVREGRWFWECKITSGIARQKRGDASATQRNGSVDDNLPLDIGGHVRVGWARREASLDAPVGFDAYSYGLRDVDGQKVHMSRPTDFFPPGVSLVEGDVIGLEISLPPMSLHRQIVEGNYNPAVDGVQTSSGELTHSPDVAVNIIRDRIPIRYKQNLYFEQYEYSSVKELEDLCHPAPASTSVKPTPPSPTHPSPALRTLPASYIRIYHNGKLIGTPFESLLAFMTPASKPQAPGAREGLDDGQLGYYPALSVFRGGAAEVNFGPDFWCPPSEIISHEDEGDDDDVDMIGADSSPPLPLSKPRQGTRSASGRASVRPMFERYAEQIAEDVVWDLVDEVDFWVQDGEAGAVALTQGKQDHVSKVGSEVAVKREGDIKELVQEEE